MAELPRLPKCDLRQVVLLRHGESVWHKEHLFTGCGLFQETRCWSACAAETACVRVVKHLDEVSDTGIVELNIPTGIPLVYELDEDLKPVHH